VPRRLVLSVLSAGAITLIVAVPSAGAERVWDIEVYDNCMKRRFAIPYIAASKAEAFGL
jgi:hypothetical protein